VVCPQFFKEDGLMADAKYRVTVAVLEKLGACEDVCEEFKEKFPKGLPFSPRSIKRYLEMPKPRVTTERKFSHLLQDISWLLVRLLKKRYYEMLLTEIRKGWGQYYRGDDPYGEKGYKAEVAAYRKYAKSEYCKKETLRLMGAGI
jgi:hypothetical protein